MWIEFKGINSEELGIVVENLPIAPNPIRNVTPIIIPGMDGSLVQTDDTYPDMEYAVLCRALPSAPFRLINDWLCGSGDLITSREPDKKYRARFNARQSDNDLYIFLRTTLSFMVYPFMFDAETETITLTSSGTIYNTGTRFSFPIITVYGAGTLTIGDYELTISATAGEAYVIINSEIQECYYTSALNRGNKVTGEFPQIDPGECAVTLGAGITRVDIQGNWRYR